MQLKSPIEAVSAAIYHAAHIAFPDIHYQDRDWEALENIPLAERKKIMIDDTYPMVNKVRRPQPSEVEVVAMFSQTWGSTALGFGGMGGAAMTRAYTVVVRSPTGDVAVYWRGQHAYTLDTKNMTADQRKQFESDIKDNQTYSVNDAVQRYGAVGKAKKTNVKIKKS